MQANERFSYVSKGQLDFNALTVMQLYYPIIKADAYILYAYFHSFYDDGQKSHAFYDILNHTLFKMSRFEEALSVLTAVNLIRCYQDKTRYLIELKQPLSKEQFLGNGIYQHMLEDVIGQSATKELLPQEPLDATDVSKNFSQVFGQKIDTSRANTQSQLPFDLANFKRLMTRDGLLFTNEKTDVIALVDISERFHLTWYDCYQLAKATANQNRIQINRMLAKKEQKQIKDTTFSEKEQIIIREAKSDRSEIFLAKLKKPKQAVVTRDERLLLADMAKMGLLDEVINVMILYTMNKTKSVNLQKNYILKLANDFMAKKITEAESAIVALRINPKKSKPNQKQSVKKSNVPNWSNDTYQNTTTKEEQQKLEAYRQQMLERLDEITRED